ncbi:hypothetical protein CAP50_10040 [Psychrobacter sp. L7]|nr:hypothetical protein CAP50_10040 [Psychrobacter sp. L7]
MDDSYIYDLLDSMCFYFFGRRLGRVLNLIDSYLNGLKMAKRCRIADEYLDINGDIFLIWRQFISFLSPFLK